MLAATGYGDASYNAKRSRGVLTGGLPTFLLVAARNWVTGEEGSVTRLARPGLFFPASQHER